VRGTIDYCEHLFRLGDRRLSCYISPMGPFLDPGSRGFEEPERFGYRLFARTLEEHRRLLVQPTWEHILNYETKWMTRRELVDATYDAAERLNELKMRYGRISARRGRQVATSIAEARALWGGRCSPTDPPLSRHRICGAGFRLCAVQAGRVTDDGHSQPCGAAALVWRLRIATRSLPLTTTCPDAPVGSSGR
jgi:hypothetical protein